MRTYREDRAWADGWFPRIRDIVGPHLLEPAPLERDLCEATDLIVMRARDMTIAARLRMPGYLQYGWQFTVRCFRPSKAKTELAKIIDGWADCLFYGHGDRRETPATDPTAQIIRWQLIDLHML